MSLMMLQWFAKYIRLLHELTFVVYRHEMVIQELTKFNQDVLQTLADVRSRLEQLESANSSARAVGFSARSRGAPDGCSRSPSPEVKGKKGKGRKELKIKVYTGPKGLGLPTPMITVSPAFCTLHSRWLHLRFTCKHSWLKYVGSSHQRFQPLRCTTAYSPYSRPRWPAQQCQKGDYIDQQARSAQSR